MVKEKDVQPIRSLQEIKKMKDSLYRHSGYRNYFLFVFGINTGLRISDILPLQVHDIRNRQYIRIREQKTEKLRIICINEYLHEEIEAYTRPLKSEEFLF